MLPKNHHNKHEELQWNCKFSNNTKTLRIAIVGNKIKYWTDNNPIRKHDCWPVTGGARGTGHNTFTAHSIPTKNAFMLSCGGLVVVWCTEHSHVGLYTGGSSTPLSQALPKIRPSGRTRIMILMTPVQFFCGENNVDLEWLSVDTFTVTPILIEISIGKYCISIVSLNDYIKQSNQIGRQFVLW